MRDHVKRIIQLIKIFGLDLGKEISEEVTSLAEERKVAKNNRDFETSDRLRDEILSHGYIVKDTERGFELEEK